MAKLICLICFICLYFCCQKTEAVKLKGPKYESCTGWNKDIVSKIAVSPDCSNPCELKRGTNVTVSVNFKSAVASKTLKAKVYGIVAGVKVPFPLNNDNGCKSGVQCPIKQNGEYKYNSTIDVRTTYPAITLIVQWEMFGDNEEKVFCFAMPVKIV